MVVDIDNMTMEEYMMCDAKHRNLNYFCGVDINTLTMEEYMDLRHEYGVLLCSWLFDLDSSKGVVFMLGEGLGRIGRSAAHKINCVAYLVIKCEGNEYLRKGQKQSQHDKTEHENEKSVKSQVKVKDGTESEEILNGPTHKPVTLITNPTPQIAKIHLGNPKFSYSSKIEDKEWMAMIDGLGSGYQQKDRKPSQNDKTEHGMEKTVQSQGQSPKMPKPEPELKNTVGCNLNPSDG
ncbi:hypothetical protein Tco_1073376, partial [Tanacetum coccineum]